MKEHFHHVARGIIIKEKSILVCKAVGYPELLFLPGGHVEFGESAKAALKRELQEELGVTSSIGSFLGLIENKWENDEVLNCEINQFFLVESNDLKRQSRPASKEGHLSFFWLDVKDPELNKLQPSPIDQFVQQYIAGKKHVLWASSL